jgi:hypothetical protein
MNTKKTILAYYSSIVVLAPLKTAKVSILRLLVMGTVPFCEVKLE